MKLKICDGLTLPLDIVTARIATYGTSGAGKTAFGRLLAEKVHGAGHRFCAIDLKNDWWGLKSSADGNSAGIPVVVFGGPRRDVQLFPDDGAAVADTVAAIGQSCIIDLDELSKGKQLKFLTSFLERLYDVNREPLLLICDEADRYAPQKAMSVEANISLGAAEDICRRGRKRGIGSMWLTQRTAVLNKNVSDICDLTAVFRTPGARDLKELEDRVARVADKVHVAEVMRLAPGLADGEAILLSSHPKFRDELPAHARPIQLPLPSTYDSSATPGVGKRRAEPRVLAKADLAAIEQKMAAQVQRAKDEDPAALRARISELQRENAKLQQTAADSQPREVSVFTGSDREFMREMGDRIQTDFLPQITRLRETEEIWTTHVVALREMLACCDQKVRQDTVQKHSFRPQTHPAVVTAAPAPRSRTAPASVGDGKISAAQQRILDALAWNESIGQARPSVLQVGAVALIDSSGGYFSNAVGPLSSAGLVVRGNGVMSLTEVGRGVAHVPETIATLSQYHAMLKERVRKARNATGKTVAMLEALMSYGGEPMTAADLGAEVGVDHTGGYFGNSIGPLSTLGLVSRSSGVVRPTEILFPPGVH